VQDCHERIDIYRSFCMKLINFTLSHAVLMVAKLVESFFFLLVLLLCMAHVGERTGAYGVDGET